MGVCHGDESSPGSPCKQSMPQRSAAAASALLSGCQTAPLLLMAENTGITNADVAAVFSEVNSL